MARTTRRSPIGPGLRNKEARAAANVGVVSRVLSVNVARVRTNPDPRAQSNVTGNIIDVGPDGHTLADANVLTSPDQFQFASLGGAGTDGLTGVLSDINVTTGAADLPTVTAPTLGDAQPIIDLDLNGNANTGGEHGLLDTQHPLGIV